MTLDPGSDRYAVSEKRYCNGSADLLIVVHVGRAGRPQDETEVFVARGARGDTLARWVSMAWTGKDRLQIAYTERVQLLKRATKADGAIIDYRVTEPIPQPEVP